MMLPLGIQCPTEFLRSLGILKFPVVLNTGPETLGLISMFSEYIHRTYEELRISFGVKVHRIVFCP
jgi:hypothetical protein